MSPVRDRGSVSTSSAKSRPDGAAAPPTLEELKARKARSRQRLRRKGDLMTINMGPQHPSMHGVYRAELDLDGEVIVAVRPEIGNLHRASPGRLSLATVLRRDKLCNNKRRKQRTEDDRCDTRCFHTSPRACLFPAVSKYSTETGTRATKHSGCRARRLADVRPGLSGRSFPAKA